MLLLGFSSGLPILLIFSTLSVWLFKAGIDRSTITPFSWVGFAYAFKYLWSPIVDNFKIPFFVPNILAGILKVRNSVFFITTLI